MAPPSYTTLRYERQDELAILTLNRPEVHNALNQALRDEMKDALTRARFDDQVRALILTGAGDRTFCAGLDLKEFAAAARDTAPTDIRRFRWADPHPLSQFDKPLIAAINGQAIGGGVELALLCDLIIAAEHSTFALSEVKRGLMPGNGGTQRLSRRVGVGRALDIILTGRAVGAQEAAAIGLAEYVVPGPRLLETAMSIGQTMAGNAPVAVRFARDAVRRGADLTLDEGLRLESDLAAFLYTTADAHEGPAAFLEKRRPTWTGK